MKSVTKIAQAKMNVISSLEKRFTETVVRFLRVEETRKSLNYCDWPG